MGIKKDRRYIKIFLPILIIIPFLGFFLYFLLFSTSPIYLIRSLLFDYKPKVVYETFKIYLDSSISESNSQRILKGVDDIVFNGIKRFEFVQEKNADFVLAISDSKENVMLSKELIPVGHIYWVRDTANSKEFKEVLMEKEEYEFAKEYIQKLWNVDVRLVESLPLELKKSEQSIGLVYPSKITKDLKVLSLNGKDLLKEVDSPLLLSYTLEGDERAPFVLSIIEKNVGEISSDTLQRDDLVKINMTGVTAISRGLAMKIDSSGNYTYPTRDIGKFLADADLTHTSNEASFVEGCSVSSGMRFCSKPKYIEILKASGIDIVELTGNHNNDFGAENNRQSIEMYKALGWDYFGGGLNTKDSEKILYKEVKGSKIAFLGYNYYDSMLNTMAIAGESRAGANHYSQSKVESDIKEAKENADVVIVTFQFQECYSYPPTDVIYPICYKPLSSPDQKGVFRSAIDFGADVVVGTQAHQPQTYELYKGGSIFYGLGNLYFDQYRWIGTRQGLVLSLYILEGELIQTKLTPTIYDRDLIPRVANETDGKLLLDLLKSARNF